MKTPPFPPLRVLLVDDDSGIRKLVRRVLVRAGYEVVESVNGMNALQQIQAGRFDLLITDIVMPDMDGLELIRKLRSSHPHVPILAMSGGGKVPAPVYLRLAEALGAGKVLAKPFEIPTLLEAISFLVSELPTESKSQPTAEVLTVS